MKMEKRKRLKKTAARVCALTLALAVMLSLSGCRESKVIEEILYDQASQDIDYENLTKVANNDENNTQKDPNLSKKKIDKSKRDADQKKVAAKKGSNENEGKAAKEIGDQKAKDGKSNQKKKKDGKGKGKGAAAEGQKGGGASEDPNKRPINDESGKKVKKPEKVDSVVVAGSGAGLVQMLGGRDILAGTSESFANNSLAQSVFSGQGVNKAKQLWSGDGTTPMSDSSFQELLRMKPDVCIGMGGESNFSDAQLKKLQEAGIYYLAVPRMNTADNIEAAVTIMGDLIGERSKRGGLNAREKADEYVDYCKDLVNEVTGKTGLFTWNNIDFNNDLSVNGLKKVSNASTEGNYTLYVSDWDSSATFQMSEGGSIVYKEQGVAVAPKGYSNSPLSYYLSVAGVCNNGARFSRGSEDEYAAVPLVINGQNPQINGSSLNVYSVRTESFLRAKAGDIDVSLGEKAGDQNEFPAIIVGSESVKSSIESSEMWKKRDRVKVGNETDIGFESNGTLIRSLVKGDYEIYVNPEGVCSWTDGSIESVLESVWAAWKFSGQYSESEVRDKISDFYSRFYGHSLSGSELNDILNGK